MSDGYWYHGNGKIGGEFCHIKPNDKHRYGEYVKVVRCKDCKWYEWGLTECHNPRYGDGWANYPPPQVYDEYFCKDGEREVEE